MNEIRSKCCLFPQILECPHRHYAKVHLTSLSVELICEKQLSIRSHSSQWTIRRSSSQLETLDSLIHCCLVERNFSRLPSTLERELYFKRLNELLNSDGVLSALKCVLILNWLECDNNGMHLIGPQDSEVNQRAIGAALVVREWRFSEQEENSCLKFLTLNLQELVSVLQINGFWTKGKKGLEVGLFPSECVRIIDESVVKRLRRRRRDDSSELSSPLVVRRLHRISSLFPHFFQKLVSPEQKRFGLNVSEILEPRVFGRDLSEQLFDSKTEIPGVLSSCSQFIESHLLDGIYRLSGVSSNISRLRQQFDCGLMPALSEDQSVLSDIHCVSSCLKLFFRLLPNPLLTFESYDEFVSCLRDDTLDDDTRLKRIRFLVRRLPPPHFRTVRALMRHLRRVSLSSSTTGMTEKNLSIVWAPNLLRSRDIENGCVGGDLAALQVIGIQAVLTEYLIQKFSLIFEDNTSTETTLSTTDSTIISTTDSTTDSTTICETNKVQLRKGWFGRQMSERVVKNSSQRAFVRWKSFESFFSKKDSFFSDFRLNFAKIQTIFDLIHVLPQFERKVDSRVAVWTTTATLGCRPTTSLLTTSDCIEIKSVCLRNDAIVVRQTSRERIERIKAQRRQQLRQQFSLPVPTPRKVGVVAAKVDSWRTTPPVPTPRAKSKTEAEIRILTTSARNKRHNNWNEIQIFNKK